MQWETAPPESQCRISIEIDYSKSTLARIQIRTLTMNKCAILQAVRKGNWNCYHHRGRANNKCRTVSLTTSTIKRLRQSTGAVQGCRTGWTCNLVRPLPNASQWLLTRILEPEPNCQPKKKRFGRISVLHPIMNQVIDIKKGRPSSAPKLQAKHETKRTKHLFVTRNQNSGLLLNINK